MMKWFCKHEKAIDRCVFGILLIVYSVMLLMLFYRQTISYQNMYESDMEAYVLETQGLDSGYEFPYRLFFWISRIWMLFVSPQAAVAFTTMLLNSFSVILLKYYFEKSLKKYALRQMVNWNFFWDTAVTIMVFALFFVSMYYGPKEQKIWGYDYIYRCNGIFTPNPYWNATYLAARPFSIISFFLTAEMLEEYEKSIPKNKAVFLGTAIFLSAFTKPSFAFVLLPVVGLTLFYRLCRTRLSNWKETLCFGGVFLPTGVLLILQYIGVFTGHNLLGEETGIGFEVGKAWGITSGNIPLSIMLALLFPFSILALNWKEIREDAQFRLSWQLLAIGMLTCLVLYEKGFRMGHMNFSWGYMYGMFFVFSTGGLQILKNLMGWKPWIYKAFVFPELYFFMYHLQCGVEYFLYLYQGGNTGGF